MARSLYNDHTNSIEDICKTLGISRATLYRSLDVPERGAEIRPDQPSRRE